MFDLNEAVANWRRRLAARPDIQTGDLDELEDHLREGVTELQASGLSEEEAFLVAARRLGDADALAGEFAAADPGTRRRLRLRWIVVGALAMLALAFLGDVGSGLMAGGLGLVQVGPPLLGMVSALTRVLVLVVGVLLVWRLLTDDRAAARVRGLGFWRFGLVGALLIALLVVFAAVALRGGSVVMMSHGMPMPHVAHVAVVNQWLRMGTLLVLPVLLLLVLWGLVRPRAGKR